MMPCQRVREIKKIESKSAFPENTAPGKYVSHRIFSMKRGSMVGLSYAPCHDCEGAFWAGLIPGDEGRNQLVLPDWE